MKTLLMMRHGKSSWKDESLTDHERPLNRRGREAAAKIGEELARRDLLPDAILCSSAVRARQTCERVMEDWKSPVEPRFLSELYHCPPDRFPKILRSLSNGVERVLVIGHNPGLAEFLAAVCGYDDKYPTAALAWLTSDVAAWSALDANPSLHLEELWRPRDLD